MICNICPKKCNIDRSVLAGLCQAPDSLKVSSYQLHYGEEPVLSGKTGSGTIFFAHCNLHCVFCQNYRISALGTGVEVSAHRLIGMICELVRKGATNINLVSPTPYTTYLVPVLQEVKSQGIGIPIVWNSNCYESVETLKLLEGLVDIYLPDFKYWDDECSATYSGVRNYREIAQESLKEMIRQTGHLLVDEDGLAFFGTMIRLLVLPSGVSHIKEILHWLHDTFGSATHISLMSQYYPAYKACEFAEINRGVTKEEYAVALKAMEELGFENGFVQEPATTPEWTPTF